MATHDKRAQLQRDGFCLFPQLLPPSLLEELRDVTGARLAQQNDTQRAATRSQGSMLPTTVHPLLADLIALPQALDALRSLGARDITFSDGYIISKPGGSPRLFWHYDWFAWQDPTSWREASPQLFAMYYLSDTSRENGCLRVIPGSHARDNVLHPVLAEPHSQALSEARDLSREEFSTRPDELDVPVRAGDLVVGDARLLHAAHENTTSERRTVITLWYQPDFGSLPPRLQAQIAAKTQPLPASWLVEARAKVEPLLPRTNNAAPYERTLREERFRPR